MTTEKSDSLKVLSPFNGWCAALEDNPDPVFRDRILGDGVSIDPTQGSAHAPFDGEVLSLPESRHAINLRADNGAEFLIHIGVDTVGMAGNGFQAHVSPGDRVEAGQLLLSFDLEKVLLEATSLKTPVLLLSEEFVISRSSVDIPVSCGETMYEVQRVKLANQLVESPVSSSGNELSEYREMVAVGLEHGIHARPAACLKAAIADLDASVSCQLGQQSPADARSPVALMSQGISYGDIVTVVARGADAQQALGAFVPLLEPLDLDEVELKARSEPAVGVPFEKVPVAPPSDGDVIKAQPASPGLAMGRAFKLATWSMPTDEKPGSLQEEKQKLEKAIKVVCRHLQGLSVDGAGTGAEIAEAHLALMSDPAVSGRAFELLESGLGAARAWHESISQSVEILLQVDDKRMRERVDDLKDMNLRVQKALAGQDPGQALEIPENSILLAENLLPSQLLELGQGRVAGICTAAGGTTSHVAILAISLEIPMLVATGDVVLAIDDGDRLTLDAEFGELTVRPDENVSAAFEKRLGEERDRRQLEQAAALNECRTRDGKLIHFNANLASAQEAVAAVEAGAEGCGLLRTEFIFMSRAQAPGVEQQLDIYQQISDALQGRPMVVRTLDAGGDKPISYIEQPDEENPALGVRGIRLSLDNRSLLETQLEALLRLKRSTPLQVMIPMVTSVDELVEVREIVDSVCKSSGLENRIQLGVMIETPAAALIADRLAGLVDFFSIGTNDLTQYTLSMDRGEPSLAERLDTLHPAVLELVSKTAKAANKAGIGLAVCGGAAGDMMIAPLLLGLGIRELSMPQSLIARQKARLRELSVADCTSLAQTALSMSSARDVRAMMRKFYGS